MRKVFLGALFFALPSLSFANSGYTPPESPPLYSEPAAQTPPSKFSSQNYFGFGLDLGQSRDTGKESPLPAFGYEGFFGTRAARGSWNLLEFEGGLLGTNGGHSKADVNMPLGIILRAGYGYTFSPDLYGVVKIGIGLGRASYDEELRSGKAMVNLAQAAYEIVSELSSGFSVGGGFSLTQMSGYFKMGDKGNASIAINLVKLGLFMRIPL